MPASATSPRAACCRTRPWSSAALAQPRSDEDLVALPVWGGRSLRRQTATWLPAITTALALPESELPDLKVAQVGPPPARSWPDRDPAAAARLSAARTAMAAIADEHTMPVENLLAPDTVRRLAWEPPGGPAPDATEVAEFLAAHGARRWQVSLTAAVLAGALDRATRQVEVEHPA